MKAAVARVAGASGVAVLRVLGDLDELHMISNTMQSLGDCQHTFVVLPSSPGEDLEQSKRRGVLFRAP